MYFKNFIKENKLLIISAIAVAVIFCIVFSSKKESENTKIISGQTIEQKKFDYESVLNSIEAKSYYVYDVIDQKPIFAKDEHEKLPLASITKLMSGLVVFDIMPETTIVTITKDDVAMEGDTGLIVGEKWKLKDLLDFSLITSSNDGMHAIASSLNYYDAVNNKDTVKIMNEKATNLGMNDTIFINETGLDIDTNMSGAYSSAFDVSLLFQSILKKDPTLISSTNKKEETFISESNIKHSAVNTNEALNKISGLIASKTGFTNLAGGNLAVIFDAGFMHPVVVVVLGSTSDGRFSDAVKLEQLTLQRFSDY